MQTSHQKGKTEVNIIFMSYKCLYLIPVSISQSFEGIIPTPDNANFPSGEKATEVNLIFMSSEYPYFFACCDFPK